MLNTFFKDACKEIDAGIFSGDAIISKTDREEFKYYLNRWIRECKSLDYHDTNKED